MEGSYEWTQIVIDTFIVEVRGRGIQAAFIWGGLRGTSRFCLSFNQNKHDSIIKELILKWKIQGICFN